MADDADKSPLKSPAEADKAEKNAPETSKVQVTPDSDNTTEVAVEGTGTDPVMLNPDIALLTQHATATDGQGVERIVGTLPDPKWEPAQVEASEAEIKAAQDRVKREEEAAQKRADLLKPIDTSDRKAENP